MQGDLARIARLIDRIITRAQFHTASERLAVTAGLTLSAGSVLAQPVAIIQRASASQPATTAITQQAVPQPTASKPEEGKADTAGVDTSAKTDKPPDMSKEEAAALKAQYEALSKDKQAEMRAYYKDLEIDLDALLGLSSAASADSARVTETVTALSTMDFARTPTNVLGARAKLGFDQVPYPNPSTARGADIANWVYLQVMAGEWAAFSKYLDGRPKDEAQQLYSRVLQSLNTGKAELLPEEVLALAEACPEEPKPWQTGAWAAMLKAAAERNSPATMLTGIKTGTRFFGAGDAAQRRRTVDFLSGAGLVVQAYEYLTPLEEARAQGDGDLVLVHALYKRDLAAKAGSELEGKVLRNSAWDLFCEASLMDRTSTLGKREAIRQAIGLMSGMPRAKVTPWLRNVFASDALGTTALETIVLRAAAVASGQGGGDRAQSIVTLKEAVDVLLERRGADATALRVPMRMLTTSLVSEMEALPAKKGRQNAIAEEAQQLMRAIPSKAWLDALEPSLASRAAMACIGIATMADETDIALTLVAEAVKRSPDQAAQIADHFLQSWESHLNPKSEYDENMMMYFFWREYITQAPLTRGRQRRNLERLGRLMDTLHEAGVDPRTLPSIAAAFKACHGITEVYELADIERVFGPLDQIPASTASALAQTMAASLNGDWRNRAVQVQKGVNRTDNEIAQLVDKGYGVALRLVDSCITHEPDSWRHAAIKAGLSYDRVQFRASQKKQGEAAKEAEYRAAAFDAFEKAALRYADALQSGQDREDVGVYERWFGAAMGTSQLNFLKADDMPAEGSAQDDQVDRIRRAIEALPPDAASRHLSDFARAVGAAVSRSDPEVKPKLVKHALRVIGKHPAGASLRALDELYRDLVKDEIKLRLTIDGDDRVGVNRQFGVMISLRFTNAVDRETGGFSKYLQTSVYTRVGRNYQEVNFREKFQKSIEQAFDKGFVVESIGFFDPFMPPRGVVEAGQDGWIEKPMAYVVLSRKDPTIDRLSQLTMDMQFEDNTGPVTLVLPSNTPPIAVQAGAEGATTREALEFKVTQVVDPRDAIDGEKDKAVKLEVIFRGKGALPELKDVLTGLDGAIDGYVVDAGSIEAKPATVMQEGDAALTRFYWGPPKPPENGYPEPDAHGFYRLPVERSWILTYKPASASLGDQFRLPELKAGLQATMDSRYYSDMDLVPVVGNSVSVKPGSLLRPITLGIGAVAFLLGSVIAYRRTRRQAVATNPGMALPENVTPLSTVMTLRRIVIEHGGALGDEGRQDLQRDIALIELKYFGPGGEERSNGDLGKVLQRWSGVVSERTKATKSG